MGNIQDLVSFNSSDGSAPDPSGGISSSDGALAMDAAGDIYGTTQLGGTSNYGTVFEILKTPTGYGTTPTTLLSFTGSNGYYPNSTLTFDTAGNLYGSTFGTGGANSGTVFELPVAATTTGYSSTVTNLYSPTSGAVGGITDDASGNLYTVAGGQSLLELTKTSTGYSSTPTVLFTVSASTGNTFSGNITFDASGNIFGVAAGGGSTNYGIVYELTKTASGYSSAPTTLVTFNNTNGSTPNGGLIQDAAGDLFGTTKNGGASGYGTVFEIAKMGTSYSSTPTTLASFNGFNGFYPSGGLVMDSAGDLFGVTQGLLPSQNPNQYTGGTGPSDFGTVFEIAKTDGVYNSTPVTVATFNFSNGENPGGTLMVDAQGNLYGGTTFGGSADDGAVFEVTDTGFIVCFRSGTRIRTALGDLAVEHLAVGDLVVTASGALRPIRWLGHRTIDCRSHPHPRACMPIRVSAQAFGPDKPARDLFVSPGHAIYADLHGGVLIPAQALVNGTTVRQVEVDHVTYWHVELDGHDILLAENLPAESYLEMGNRSFFRETDVVALDAVPDAAARTHTDFCRPFHESGPLVDVVRAELRVRAMSLGWTMNHGDPFGGLHLAVDGQRIEPTIRGLAAGFPVPGEAKDIRLMSATSRACDLGDSGDGRDLGVCLAGLTVNDGFDMRRLDLADPRLSVGFHVPEDGGRRWTNGCAPLPAALWSNCPHGFFLRVDLAGPALPRWAAPVGRDTDFRYARRTATG